MCNASSPGPKGAAAPTTATDNGTLSLSCRLVLNLLIDLTIILYTIGFAFFRIGELIPLIALYPRQCTSAFLGTCVLHCSPCSPSSSLLGRGSKRLLHMASLLMLVYTMDNYATKPLPSPAEIISSHENNNNNGIPKTIVITGANSGVGFETARQLAVTYGMNVVMGCRSADKCEKAANAIRSDIRIASPNNKSVAAVVVTPLPIDLSNFDSVTAFVSLLKEKGIRANVLFNNAGHVPASNVPVNDHGFDPSFTSMHLSHFLLTELLLKENNPSLSRVVNTSSGTHHLCALPFSYAPKFLLDRSWLLATMIPQNPGCVDEDFLNRGMQTPTEDAAYIQAKVANAMHVVELSRRHERVAAIAIDLGWVGTSIQPFMTGSLLSPTGLGWMRNAKVGVLPVLHAILGREEDLIKDIIGSGSGSGSAREQRGWSEGGIVMNVFGRTEEAFSYPWWTSKGASGHDLGRRRMMELGSKLWTTSEDIFKGKGYL